MAYPCLLFVRILERIFRLMSLAYHSFMILWKGGIKSSSPYSLSTPLLTAMK